jgi:hypothetical protein
VVLDREHLDRLRGRALHVVDHRPQQRRQVARLAGEFGRGRLELRAQRDERRILQCSIERHAAPPT